MADQFRPYVVREGDYLPKLAHALGFDADEVWNHEKNADLKATRPDPNTLCAGDILYLPEKPREGLDIIAGTTNAYVAEVPMVHLALAFHNFDGTVRADADYEILGLDGDDTESELPNPKGKTDGEGVVRFSVPVTLREVSVFFPYGNVTHRVSIGGMDPDTEQSGLRKRLENLGYLNPETSIYGDVELDLISGLRAFQAQVGLEPTGAFDDVTRAALIDKYGI